MIASLLIANRGEIACRVIRTARRLAIPVSALMLGACGQSGQQQNAAAGNSAMSAPAASAAAPKPAECAPAPYLALTEDFVDPRQDFVPGKKPFEQLQERFAEAYAKACASGILKDHPLIDPASPHPAQLFLKNAPDANVASIYQAGADGAVPGDVLLEYDFITSDGRPHVPTAQELGEAIYCTVHGASSEDEQGSGRCLPD